MRILLAIFVLLGSSCVVGAPPGFSSGKSWSIPVAQPLDDSTLLVPILVNGKGPFLFALNTDWETSSMDYELATRLELRMTRARETMGASDSLTKEVNVDVSSITLGDLTITRPSFRARDDGHQPYPGLRVYGNIGRDVLADSLSLTVDRDRGMAYLGLNGHGPVKGPETQVATLEKRSQMEWRLIVKAYVAGKKALMFLDLGNRPSRIRPETGTTSIKVAGSTVRSLKPQLFQDQRVDVEDYDGALAQDFLSQFKFSIDFNGKELWLDKREEDLAPLTQERISRWGDTFAGCSNPGCVKVEVSEAVQNTESGEWTPPQLTITREKDDLPIYDVVVQPRSERNGTFGNAIAHVTLDPAKPTVVEQLDSRLAKNTEFVVLDASLFPRPCTDDGRCVTWVKIPEFAAPLPSVSLAPSSR